MNELNTYLMDMGYMPMGRCPCKGKPFRWTCRDGREVKLYMDNTWQLLQRGLIQRYGHIETAIQEIEEYYQKLLGQD